MVRGGVLGLSQLLYPRTSVVRCGVLYRCWTSSLCRRFEAHIILISPGAYVVRCGVRGRPGQNRMRSSSCLDTDGTVGHTVSRPASLTGVIIVSCSSIGMIISAEQYTEKHTILGCSLPPTRPRNVESKLLAVLAFKPWNASRTVWGRVFFDICYLLFMFLCFSLCS